MLACPLILHRAIKVPGPHHILPVFPVPHLLNSLPPSAHINGQKVTGDLIQNRQDGRLRAVPLRNPHPNSNINSNSSIIIPEP